MWTEVVRKCYSRFYINTLISTHTVRYFTLDDMYAGVLVTILVTDGMAQNSLKETILLQNLC